jgi:acyl carrier protein
VTRGIEKGRTNPHEPPRSKQERACRIVAKSLFRQLTTSGYQVSDLLAFATEFLDLVVRGASSNPPRPHEVIMHFENVLRFIRELDIDTPGLTLDSELGRDAGMDSQEIVELTLLLEKAYGIRIPDRTLSKRSTVRDTIGHVERLSAEQAALAPEREGQSRRCEARAVILRRRGDVYQALHRLEDWTRHLPHVLALDVLYDDGRYQEFTMRVASKTGTLQVRSVRDCDGTSRIDFFQPSPPPFLLHHSGGWRFTDLDGGKATEVVTFHEWRVNDEVARTTFLGSSLPCEEQVRELLLEHARAALGHWKRALESGPERLGASSERGASSSPPMSP